MFRFSENIEKHFLIGAYRTDKRQLPWILGEDPQRQEILYNVRYNENLFSNRRGGIDSIKHPEYVLIYDFKHPDSDAHLFRCISHTLVNEDEMIRMQYPQPNGSYIVYRLEDELECEKVDLANLLAKYPTKDKFAPLQLSGNQIKDLVNPKIAGKKLLVTKKCKNVVTFIDLFAGIGGIRCGLEQAIREIGYEPMCVFTSEIKPYAVKVLHDNHPTEKIAGDITQVSTMDIPDFDILCAGFPCQAFSSAGKRKGFADTRGTMFFEVERILRDKQPKGFILENVEGLVNHDNGETLRVITDSLRKLNYKFDYRVLNSRYFGVAQERKRIYIVGTKYKTPNLDDFPVKESHLEEVLEHGKPIEHSPFIDNLLSHFTIEQLYGKSIKDKRGGKTNIHSWDLGIKGSVTNEEKQLLDTILRERRKHTWAEEIGIDWMDGMPLTTKQIRTFFDVPNLQQMLTKLAKQGYLKYEYPKKLVIEKNETGVEIKSRVYDITKPQGYNIIAGKLSFEINKVLSPNDVAPTLVAMDMQKLYVGDNGGLRRLTLREGLRLCGYPDDIIFNVSEKEGFDLLGNTVVVPVIKAVAGRLLEQINF